MVKPDVSFPLSQNGLNSRCVIQKYSPNLLIKMKEQTFRKKQRGNIHSKMTFGNASVYRFSYHICETTDGGCATFQKEPQCVSFLTLIKRWGERKDTSKIYF